jgi:protein tyrosine/serine phosphatase
MKTFTRIIGVPGTENLGIIADPYPIKPWKQESVYRSAQPNNYSELKSTLNLKSILNLRSASKQEEVESAGLKYFQLRLNVFSDVTPEDFDLILQVITNPDNQPILIH